MVAANGGITDMLRVIDRYAFTNRLRDVDPAQKSSIVMVTILLCLLLDHPRVGWLVVAWMVGLAVWYARLPWRVVVAVVGSELTFLVISVISVAVSVSLTPPTASSGVWSVGPFWLSMSSESLDTAARLLSRALGSIAALNFLILTTPLVDLLEVVRRLWVPPLLVELMMLSYRAIFVLLDTLERMVTAQSGRLGYASWWSALRSSALIGSRLFVETYHRSKALDIALLARGFDGELRVLPLTYRHERRLWVIGGVMIVSLLWARWGA